MNFFKTLFILVLVSTFSNNLFSQTLIDSLKTALANEKNELKKAKILNDLSWEIAPTDYHLSIEYANKALELIEKKDTKLSAEAYTCLGSANDLHGKYDLAILNYQKSFDGYKSIKDETGMAKVYLNIGASFYYRGVFAKALENYLEAAKIQEKINDKETLAKTFNNIGLIYRTKNNNQKALEYFSKSLKIKKKLNDKKGVCYTYSNIGIIHQNQKHCDSALWYANASLKLSKEIQSSFDIGTSLVNIGEAYFCLENYKEAKKFYLDAEKILIKNTDDNTLAFCYKGLGNVFEKEHNLEKALIYYEKGIQYAKATERNELLSDLYRSVYEIEEKLQHPEKALNYYKLYSQMKDSVFSIESNRNLNELEIVYETDKKQNLIEEKEAEQKRLKSYIIALGFVLLIVISSIYIVNKQRRKLASQKKILETLVDEKNTLLKETHHRVKNNFQIVSSLLYLQSESLQNKAAIDAIREAQNRVRSMILIHQRLYNRDEIVGINAKEYITDLVNDLTEYQATKIENLKTEISVENLVFNVDTITPIGLMVNELVTNIIKHAFDDHITNPLIKVDLHKQDEEVILIVSDNGKGLVEEPNPDSFGIKLIHSLSKKLKGKVTFTSENGTIVTIIMKRFTLV